MLLNGDDGRILTAHKVIIKLVTRRFIHTKDEDLKFVGVSPSGTFGHIHSIEQLLLEKPAVLEILKSWFLNYKKPGKMVFYRYMDRNSSIQLLKKAQEKWKSKN